LDWAFDGFCISVSLYPNSFHWTRKAKNLNLNLNPNSLSHRLDLVNLPQRMAFPHCDSRPHFIAWLLCGSTHPGLWLIQASLTFQLPEFGDASWPGKPAFGHDVAGLGHHRVCWSCWSCSWRCWSSGDTVTSS
jgi:hypothetical protein